MEKKTRRERKEEERAMLKDFDEAVAKLRGDTLPSEGEKDGEEKEEIMHCPRCRSIMQKGRCPTCRHTVYVPMEEGKRKKIRIVVGVIAVVIFLVLFISLRAK